MGFNSAFKGLNKAGNHKHSGFYLNIFLTKTKLLKNFVFLCDPKFCVNLEDTVLSL